MQCPDTSIVKTERFGYVVLRTIVNGEFDCCTICKGAEDIYNEVMSEWEWNYLYNIGTINDWGDSETYESQMTVGQRKEREEIRNYYQSERDKIIDVKQ